MKTHVLFFLSILMCVSCNGQKNEKSKTEIAKKGDTLVTQPKGVWRVDKEFDENGNLIRYDSIYSWSSQANIDKMDLMNKDSLLQSFKSKFFTDFSVFEDEGFEDIFAKDSLFSDRYFNKKFFESEFGKDFMDIDKLRQQMLERQREFLEKYQSEFNKPKIKN